ncbi:MAG: hypothetical protein J6S85_17585 [Methanobrevibacter sp.]|nr:hypothetical protein [Methanobrevibacter sp.]
MILADAKFNEDIGATCLCKISGNAELIAVEYATITKGLMNQQGGQAILDRAMDIMKKEIDDEEKRS